MLDTHRQCMTPVAAGNTNPVALISYSFVCLGLKFVATVLKDNVFSNYSKNIFIINVVCTKLQNLYYH